MNKKVYFKIIGIIFLIHQAALSQSIKESLKTRKVIADWRAAYKQDFNPDSASYFQFITADSVFIDSWTNDELQKGYTGIDYCYSKASNYAKIELDHYVGLLLNKLSKPNAKSFSDDQDEWKRFYLSESKFLDRAMMDPKNNLAAYRKYILIKNRIISIKNYLADLK